MTFLTFALGCKVNSYECEAISSRLLEEGFAIDEINPDIVIINTCSVTHVADQKSRQHIRKFRKNYPSAILVVMGCYAQGNSEFIAKETGADIVLGTSKRSEIIDKIKEFISNKEQIVDITKNTRCYEYEDLGIVNYSENIRAYLKIQDGCDSFCSYCIVPYRRGRSRSRSFDSIIKEAETLVEKGYKEIVLTGIHIGKYGKDIGTSFSSLVEALLNIKDLYRLRISSLEESEIDDKLISLIATNNKLAKHLHIPLQSGCDKVLKRMCRPYTKEEYLTKLKYIKSLLPDICFTTDLIVGFPGETEEDFLETYEFIKEVGFNEIHVFPYSPRSGTPAATFKDQVDPRIKNERVKRILDLSNEQWKSYSNSQLGKEVEVIIEKYDEKTSSYVGHTSNYLEMSFKDEHQVGDIVKTKFSI